MLSILSRDARVIEISKTNIGFLLGVAPRDPKVCTYGPYGLHLGTLRFAPRDLDHLLWSK